MIATWMSIWLLLLSSDPAVLAKDDPLCRSDQDCVLSELSCGACGRCPGTPPYAIDKKSLKELEAECKKKSKRPAQPVPCSPCQSPEHMWAGPRPDKAVCQEGSCQLAYGNPCDQAKSCCIAFARDTGNKCDWESEKGDGTAKTCQNTLAGYEALFEKLKVRLAHECKQ